MKRSDYLPYLRTLRRVPDDIVLATATRDLDLAHSDRCLCGWFVREQLARVVQCDASALEAGVLWLVPGKCADAFGGMISEWSEVFDGACDSRMAHLIERAFVERVLEAVV